MRREQLALRQSKQLVPMIALSPGCAKHKVKPGGSATAPNLGYAAASASPAVGAGSGQGGGKSMVHLNGSALTKKPSLEALGRAGSQPVAGQEGAPLSAAGNGASSLVELGMLPDRPASAAASLSHRAGSGTAAGGPAPRSPAARQGESLAKSQPIPLQAYAKNASCSG